VGESRDGDHTTWSSQQIRLYIKYNHQVRAKKGFLHWYPVGYNTFAETFNEEDLPKKLATVKCLADDEVIGLLDAEAPSPGLEMFRVDPIQCFLQGTFDEVVCPGLVQVPEAEYALLRDMAVLQM
jgi:hypothetical protein